MGQAKELWAAEIERIEQMFIDGEITAYQCRSRLADKGYFGDDLEKLMGELNEARDVMAEEN